MSTFFDSIADLLHLCGAGVSSENLPTEDDTHSQSHGGDHGDHDHQGQVRACQGERWANGWDKARHSILHEGTSQKAIGRAHKKDSNGV